MTKNPPPSPRPSQLGANAENEWSPRHGTHGARPSGKLNPNGYNYYVFGCFFTIHLLLYNAKWTLNIKLFCPPELWRWDAAPT